MSRDREAILKSMLAGVDPPLKDDHRKSVLAAMQAFSVTQLDKMDRAGVRIWPFAKGLPPEFQITGVADLGSPAAYHYQFRTIRISPASLDKGGATLTDFLRHELAHAWDDVRSEKKPKNMRSLKGDALTKELNVLAKLSDPFESQATKKLPPGKFSMQEMLDRYRAVMKGLGDKTKSFAHPSTADKHNARDVMEFYAEGYSVFHGNSPTSQGRLMWLAPELFDYLEKEATGNGLAVPDRNGLMKVLDDNEKGWRDFK